MLRPALQEIDAALACTPEHLHHDALIKRRRHLKSLWEFRLDKTTRVNGFTTERRLLSIPARRYPFGKTAGEYVTSREFVHYELCKQALEAWRTESQIAVKQNPLQQAPVTPRAFVALCADEATRELSPFHTEMKQWSSLRPSTSQCTRQLALIELPGLF